MKIVKSYRLLYYICVLTLGLLAFGAPAFAGSTAEGDFFGDYARKSSPTQGAVLYSNLGYMIAPRIGVGLDHNGKFRIDFTGRLQTLTYQAPPGATLATTNESIFDFLVGVRYMGDSTRTHFYLGYVSDTYVEALSATSLDLVQGHAPQAGLDFTWLALRGPTHDLGLGMKVAYSLSSTAGNLSISNTVDVGGEAFVDLSVGGLPGALVLGTDIAAGKIGTAYQVDSRVMFGLRIYFIDTSDRGPSRFITR